MEGILSCALGLAYFMTSYMPPEQNQFLHASVPLRIFLALLAGGRLFYMRNSRSKAGRTMLLVLVYDGIGGVAVGISIRNFTGRV
ncbi:uncharacterized protein B0I36DRAFT_256905 [Microdochium trichocladiopsis]|uniref:Uncharacterized protein n=1 Tax=Microdochium trichocladiopsis TaxID=1682393 RepID=A0A9P8XQW2_9PEZI|nr:uncharacterized protein B0I36DRAFT_256905 [Microdochium trichocladiopsis]KAH7012177.1 hypothetical protein B0I36DRAFT_256905 [Microdochium trichocladiopsis]